ncbi:MAG: ABC transporter ATP-binding protein [Planctomycetota bacterium]
MQTLVEMRAVERTYRSGSSEVRALRDATLEVEEGESVAIMGRSGSGKSTLLQILGLLDRPTDGSYRLRGVDVAQLSTAERAAIRANDLGFVFQTFHLLDDLSVLENVEAPFAYRKATRREVRRLASAALDRVGLIDRAHHRPNELSGGEMQRTAIARAVAGGPRLLLADEPTGNLDEETGEEILALLGELSGAGGTLVIVTHDPDVAARMGRTLVMKSGVLGPC